MPRSEIELELAKREFDFQMTGLVSDEAQKRLGQFLGAGTIISGSVNKGAENTYRLIINAIHLESFTYQSSYRSSIQNNNLMKALIGGSGDEFLGNYTIGQRFGMGALNIFGGTGSLINGHRVGWLITGVEAAGLLTALAGLFVNPDEPNRSNRKYWTVGGSFLESNFRRDTDDYDNKLKTRNALIIAGSSIIGAGVVIGFIIPFFHNKPDNAGVSGNYKPFPLNIELVSLDNRETNGVRLSYHLKF